NYFVGNTPAEGGALSPSWQDGATLPIFFGPPLPLLFQGILLGNLSPVRTLTRASIQPPWNPTAWFDFDVTLPSETIVGDAGKVTYRIGSDITSRPSLKGPVGSWLLPDQVMPDKLLVPRLFNNLSWIIGGVDSLGSSNCSLENNMFPERRSNFDSGGPVDQHYVAIDGHRNALGMYATEGHVNDGFAFLRAAMKKGMLIDLDHLSQKARVDAYLLANQYAGEAGFATGDCASGFPCRDYPFIGVHSRVREFQINDSKLEEFRNA